MRAAAGPAIHQEAEAAAAGQGEHVGPIDVGAHIGHALAGGGILHHDARLAVVGIDLVGVGALEHGDHQRHACGGYAVHVELALTAAAATGKTGFLVLGVHHVENVVVRGVHRKVQVLRPAEGVHALVVLGLEHIVAPHAVMALAAEVEGAAIGVHVGEVLVLLGVDEAGELHGRCEAAIGHELGAVDIEPGNAVLTVAAEVDGASLVGDVEQAAVLAFLVQRGTQLIGYHHDAASDVAEVVVPEELGRLHFHLAAHGDLLQVVEQLLSIAALLFVGLPGEALQGLLVAGSTESLVGHLGIGEAVAQVVGAPQPIPCRGRDGGVLHGEFQVADGLLLVLPAMQQAGTEMIVEHPVARLQAHQLSIEGQGLVVALLVEERIGLGAHLLGASLCKGKQRQEQEQPYARGAGHDLRVAPCTGCRAGRFHWPLALLPARLMRFSSPRHRRPMFWRWV